MAKKSTRSTQDATLRNVRASRKRTSRLAKRQDKLKLVANAVN